MSIKSYENIIHKDLINPLKECKKIHHYSTKTIGPTRDSKYTTFWLGMTMNLNHLLNIL